MEGDAAFGGDVNGGSKGPRVEGSKSRRVRGHDDPETLRPCDPETLRPCDTTDLPPLALPGAPPARRAKPECVPPVIEHSSIAADDSVARNRCWRRREGRQPIEHAAAIVYVYASQQMPERDRVTALRPRQHVIERPLTWFALAEIDEREACLEISAVSGKYGVPGPAPTRVRHRAPAGMNDSRPRYSNATQPAVTSIVPFPCGSTCSV